MLRWLRMPLILRSSVLVFSIKEVASICLNRSATSYGLMWIFIGAVSLYDGYLVYFFREIIVDMERNPLGLYLLRVNDGDISLFLTAKCVGTLLTLCTLLHLYVRLRRLAFPIASGVAVAQLSLLSYLVW